jgi:arylformamidase
MIYDLTHTIDENLPVYPGDPHVKIRQVGELEKDGFADHLITTGTHNGTHMDAPAHMLAGGKGLKDYAADRLVSKAVCIDASKGFDTKEIAIAIVEPDLSVLFYTGASDYFTEERYWHEYPILDDATAQLLIRKQVKTVGIDTGSFDNDEAFPIHKALLGADILLIENLTNLKPLIGKSFELYALPLKLEADGAPARVIAKLN